MIQYAEYSKCTHEPFLKKLFGSIAHGSVGPTKRFAPDFQGRSHDIFCQIYPNLSILDSPTFYIPCLHFCFLISMVRLYANEWTGNLSVILVVAFLLSELNGKA